MKITNKLENLDTNLKFIKDKGNIKIGLRDIFKNNLNLFGFGKKEEKEEKLTNDKYFEIVKKGKLTIIPYSKEYKNAILFFHSFFKLGGSSNDIIRYLEKPYNNAAIVISTYNNISVYSGLCIYNLYEQHKLKYLHIDLLLYNSENIGNFIISNFKDIKDDGFQIQTKTSDKDDIKLFKKNGFKKNNEKLDDNEALWILQ